MEAGISYDHKFIIVGNHLSLFHFAAIHSFSVLIKSIIGFACKVVPAHYLFIPWLTDPSCSVFKLHYHICMTNEAHLDILWWSDFFPSWSGTSMILDLKRTPSLAMQLFTDAQGAVVEYWSNNWLQLEWPSE